LCMVGHLSHMGTVTENNEPNLLPLSVACGGRQTKARGRHPGLKA
jgi:hypothetical protein